MSAKGFESLSTEHAQQLEQQRRVDKMVHSKELSSKARSEFESKAGPADAAAFAKALGAKKVGRPAKAVAVANSPDHELRLRQIEALNRYTRYFNSKRQELRDACGGIAPNPKWTCEEAEAQLDRVRASLAEDAADETFKNGVIAAARGAEYVTMKLGINPARLDLNDFGEFMNVAIREEKLEPEISEGRAECGSLLTAPWQARLFYKVSNLAIEFSEAKKRVHASSAPQPLQTKSDAAVAPSKRARFEPDRRTLEPVPQTLPPPL
jgi:hypothetical protein